MCEGAIEDNPAGRTEEVVLLSSFLLSHAVL
jgi:hypothetical protein